MLSGCQFRLILAQLVRLVVRAAQMGITGKAADLLAVVRLERVQVSTMTVDVVAVRLVSMIVRVQVSTMSVKIDVLVM